MQTILGAGGAAGIELAKALPAYTDQVRLVSRNPQAVLGNESLVAADLTNAKATAKAVAGSEIVYLMAGLPYRSRFWQRYWPVVMDHTIQACAIHGAKLVFFDNIYMYAPKPLNPIIETLAVAPATKKGAVRAAIFNQLQRAIEAGQVAALVARCADFYGPHTPANSMLTATVFEPLARGKTATLLGRADQPHSYTYLPDAAKATAQLGNSDQAYGEVWHLPTAPEPPTGAEWVQLIAKALGVKPKYRVVSKGLLQFMGLFSADLRELPEMLYQYTQPYVFNSDKFLRQFDFRITPYSKGIAEIIQIDYQMA